MGLFFAVTVMGLVYYYRKTGEVSLRNCAYAMVAAFLVQLTATAVHVAGYDWLRVLSFGFVLALAIFLYAVASNLSQRKVSLTQVFLMTGTTLVIGAIILLFGDDSRTGWVLLEAPAALLIGIAIMLMGSSLAIIHLESMVASLAVKDEKLQRYEQENRRLELQFSQAQKHESLGVLAGGIAHDFNNMLTSVLGYTNLAMKKLPADSEVRKDLYMVLSGARQAADLTSQMLVYAGKGAIEFESVDISRVVDNMSGLINSIVPRKIHLVHKVATGLPLVKGDAVQIGQVAMNLIANAVDAIEDREGVVEIQTGLSQVTSDQLRKGWFSDKHEPGAYVYLRVVDTGVGMDATQIESVKGAGSTFRAYFPIISYQDVEQVTPQSATSLPARRASGIRVPVILISGYHQEQVISDISNDDDAYFIKKPFSVDDLIETANLSLQQPRAN